MYLPVSMKKFKAKRIKIKHHLILRVGFAVPVTFTSSASSSFFYRNGKKVVYDFFMEEKIIKKKKNCKI